jgi:methionyl-tRNA formyltransferase
MKIACVTYRNWASEIYDRLFKKYNHQHQFLIIKNVNDFNKDKVKSFNPNLIFWFGWSWIIKEDFINNFECVMLHPSPLPRYRGGSPIQNQIIEGEKFSSVSIFRMTLNIDDGDIYFQKKFSLDGSLNKIFRRISDIGFEGACKVIDGNYILKKQDHKKATYVKRRNPSESEITIEEIKSKSAEYLYNKIRMLNDPYPNAYIKTKDNKKLFLIKSKIEKK